MAKARKAKKPKATKAAKPRAAKPRGPNRNSTARGSRALVRAFYKSLPREKWEQILEAQAPTSDAGKLLAVMHDPAFQTASIERQCAEAGIEFRDLAKLVSEHSLGSAMIASTKHTEEVIEGIALAAKPTRTICDLCLDLRSDGRKETTIFVEHPRIAGEKLEIECPKCGGAGHVRRDGNPRHAETFLKLHGALQEAPQAILQQNLQLNFGAAHAQNVQRGQQLLLQGRQARESSSQEPPKRVEIVSAERSKPKRAKSSSQGAEK